MTPEDLTATISQIISEQFGLDETDLTPDADLILDLNATHADLQSLQARLETTFDISLPDLTEKPNLSLIELTALIEDSII